MNGIRGRTSTSPPLHIQGQQPRNNFYPPIVGSDEYTPSPQQQPVFSQNQQYPSQDPAGNYYYQQQLGVGGAQNYEIGKQGMPRMPSPGMATHPGASTSMYQPQQGGSVRASNAPTGNPPFYPNTQGSFRPPRMPSMANPPNQQVIGMYMSPSQGQYMGQAPVLMQIPGSRMQNPGAPYNHISSTQSGLYHPIQPQQNITSYTHNYGNAPLYISQPRGMPPSGQGQPQQNKKERTKHLLSIVDPNTGKDLSDEILHSQDKPTAKLDPARSTPVAGTTATAAEGPTGHSGTNEIAAQFAALVAAKLYTSTPSNVPMQQQPPPNASSQPNVPPPSHMNIPPPRLANNAPLNDAVQNQMMPPPRPMGPPPNVLPGQQHNAPVNIPVVPPHGLLENPIMMGAPAQVPPTNIDCVTVDGDSLGMSVESIESAAADSVPVVNPSIPSLSKSVPVVDSAPAVSIQQSVNCVGDQLHGESNAASKPVVSVKEPEPVVLQNREREPVTVSVEKVVSDSKTSQPVENVPATPVEDKAPVSSKREPTPEVNVTPPTPVEKEVKADYETKTPEVVVPEVAPVPKKERGKKKAKDLNKKGDKIAGSEFDAYTDKVPAKPVVVQEETKPVEPPAVVPAEAPTSSTASKPEVAKTENVKTTAPAKPTPEREVTPPTKEATPTDESVQKVEIKVIDTTTPDSTQDDELEEGEIIDDEDEISLDPKMDLRYKYAEDQWSPLNPEGKKHYDREFLLQFQYESSAVSKPEGLPDIPDVILDKPINMGRSMSRDMQGGAMGPADAGYDFTPRYVWQTPGGGRTSKGPPRSSSAQKKGGSNQTPMRQINVSISKDISLHHAEKAWKPARAEKREQSDEDARTELLYKKTRSILNKLTPQKFQTLLGQMQELPIENEAKLKGVIDLVFEKAISEPNFSVAYANMCRCLSMMQVKKIEGENEKSLKLKNKVPSSSKPGDSVNFRAVLITRCQREFERDKSSEALFATKRKEIEEAEPGKKEELRQELAYQESQTKRRSLGNIRFIGELFKLRMLTENIMHDCVFKLLRAKDPESFECLCRLLTTIGKELDTDKAKDSTILQRPSPRMDQYFQQMTKIVTEKKTASRVRFMLQDVIDLRLNKWVPRRKDNNPKTIDQIHREVEQEAQERALLAAQIQMQPRQGGGGGGRGGRDGGRRPQGAPMGADGWNTVSRTPMKNVDQSIDPSKMKFSKQNLDENVIQLGPGGGQSRFGGWSRGSTGGTTGRPSQEKEKRPSNAPANRFSALSRPEDDSRSRYGAVSPARSEGRGRGFGRPPTLGPRRSQEQEREKALSAAMAIGTSQSVDGSNRDRSGGRDLDTRRREEPAEKAEKLLTKEQMERKTVSIVEEYLHIADIKEAMLCISELPKGNHGEFFGRGLRFVLDRTGPTRGKFGTLMHQCLKDKVVTLDSVLQGLKLACEYIVAEDIETDAPKIWEYFAEFVGPLVYDGVAPMSFLKDLVEPLIECDRAARLLADILHDASHKEGHKRVGMLWAESGLKWTDYMPANMVEQFLQDKKLEFTKGGDSVPTTPTTGLPLNDIDQKLHQLIVEKKADNEVVFDWIESNVDDPTTKRSQFIRILMTAVCNSAIKGEKGKERVEPREISSRGDLLQKYLDHQPESELQALYALQALVTKLEHPPGVLRQMFDTLYDEDIISEDAFLQWEKSDEEPKGKGVALKQVVQFFTWLREAEDDS